MTANPLREAIAVKPKLTQQQICDQGNQLLTEIPRTDIEWKVVGEKAVLVWRGVPPSTGPLMDRRGQRMSYEETAELNEYLERMGAKARYRPDGTRYLVAGAENTTKSTA